MSYKIQRPGQFREEVLNGWEDFENKVVKPSVNSGETVYFRGQADSNWSLESSLYRKNQSLTINDYCSFAYKAFKTLQSLTDDKWDLSIDDFKKQKWITFFDMIFRETSDSKIDETPLRKQEPLFEFLTYLRHYGYPTPLLDWTKSAYVALFFACCEDRECEHSAIFTYQEYLNETKHITGELEIYDHPIKTHARHYLEHSAYMISIKKEKEFDVIGSIENALYFSNVENQGSQDIVSKYLIPYNLRKQYLKRLDRMNINHMTLFSDKSSMIQTLTMRHFDFNED